MNLMKMMKQAAEMQKKMEGIQADLAQKTVEFSSGGGMVTVVARDMAAQEMQALTSGLNLPPGFKMPF